VRPPKFEINCAAPLPGHRGMARGDPTRLPAVHVAAVAMGAWMAASIVTPDLIAQCEPVIALNRLNI
jgi:hypothetical protein